MRIKKVRSHISPNEALLFERSSPAKKPINCPPSMCPQSIRAPRWAPQNVRAEIEGFPEVSEVEAIRHFTRLSTWNYAIDQGMYPLGSCTMKYNPRINELVARTEGARLGASLSARIAVAGRHGSHGALGIRAARNHRHGRRHAAARGRRARRAHRHSAGSRAARNSKAIRARRF